MRHPLSMSIVVVAGAAACDPASQGPQLVPCEASPAPTGACVSNVQYSPVSSGLRLDVYKPTSAVRGYPVVLIHGGGWKRGDKAGYGNPAKDLAAAGLTVFAI